jgi:hypothetical protein
MTERVHFHLIWGIVLMLLLTAITLTGCTQADVGGIGGIGGSDTAAVQGNPEGKSAEAVTPTPADAAGTGAPARKLPEGTGEEVSGSYDLLNQNGEDSFYDAANQSGEVPTIDGGYVEGSYDLENQDGAVNAADDYLVSLTHDILNQDGSVEPEEVEGTFDLQNQN